VKITGDKTYIFFSVPSAGIQRESWTKGVLHTSVLDAGFHRHDE
jgi:hypothetical protein